MQCISNIFKVQELLGWLILFESFLNAQKQVQVYCDVNKKIEYRSAATIGNGFAVNR